MPLLHIALDARDAGAPDATGAFTMLKNHFKIALSHRISEQTLTLREAFIFTAGPAGVADIVTNGSGSGKTCLAIRMASEGADILAGRQIVSNFKGGEWFPIPCDYSIGRSKTQHYTGLNQSVALSGTMPSDLMIEVVTDEEQNGSTAPLFSQTAADNISKIDLVFEYDDFTQPTS